MKTVSLKLSLSTICVLSGLELREVGLKCADPYDSDGDSTGTGASEL